MHSCNLCGRGLLERSLCMGYKIALPSVGVDNYHVHGSNDDYGGGNYCRFIEIGLSKRPLFDVDRTDDVVVKISDTYAHCSKKRGNEIALEIDEWRAFVDHREHIERYFVNVPVIQRFMLSNSVTMYFDTCGCASGSCKEKLVFLTKEMYDERVAVVRFSEHTIKLLFALSEYVEILYNYYLSKVPYTCYVFEKFLHIIRSSPITLIDSLSSTANDDERKQMLARNYIRNHWFYDESSVIHKELTELCVDEIVHIVVNEYVRKEKCK